RPHPISVAGRHIGTIRSTQCLVAKCLVATSANPPQNGSVVGAPLDDEMITDLLRWRSETPYAGEQDWIFASGRMKGRQPLWPEAIERNYIRPAAERAKITKRISWRRRDRVHFRLRRGSELPNVIADLS